MTFIEKSKSFNTGNNAATGKNLLENAAKVIKIRFKASALYALPDTTKKPFALKCKSVCNQIFYLACRGTYPIEGYVSVHTKLINLCLKNQCPLVLHIDATKEHYDQTFRIYEFRVYDAERLVNSPKNVRDRETMSNFNFDLGEVWLTHVTLTETWGKVKAQTQLAKKGTLQAFY